MDAARTPPTHHPAPAKWAILLYSAADNDLKPHLIEDIRELETIGSTRETPLVAQLDRGGRVGAQRFLLQKSSTPDQIASPVLQALGPTDMSAPQSLADFITWGMRKCPAEHYMLVISDHGDGWKGAVQDESHEGWMSAPEIRQGLEQAQAATGRKIDVLGMDACLMANAEFAYEIKDSARFLVASEQVEGVEGWPYSKILGPQLLENLSAMQMNRIDVTPRRLAKMCVESAQTDQETLPTMSAVDLAAMPNLAQKVQRLGEEIVASSAPDALFRDIANRTEAFFGYKDLGDLSMRLSRNTACGAGVNAAAGQVRTALAQAVIAEQHSPSYAGATGLTVGFDTWGALSEGYTDLAFDRDTRWSVAQQKVALSDDGEEIPLASTASVPHA